MTDSQTPSPSNRPEYTAEQVEVSKAELRGDLATDWTDVEWCGANDNWAVVSKADIRTVLSDHARITAELTTCRETLRLKPSESLPAGVTRLALQVESAEELTALKQGIIEAADTRIEDLRSRLESAERDSKRLDYLEQFGGVKAGHVFDASVDEWTGRFGWSDGAWWTHDACGDQTQYVQDNAALREAIDAARNQEGGK